MFVIDTDNRNNFEMELFEECMYSLCESADMNETCEDKIRHGQFGDFLESFISKNLGKVADAYAEWQEDRMERCQAHEFKAIGNADGFIERYVYEHFDERGDI